MSRFHKGLVIQSCVINSYLLICFCFGQTDLRRIFAKEINMSEKCFLIHIAAAALRQVASRGHRNDWKHWSVVSFYSKLSSPCRHLLKSSECKPLQHQTERTNIRMSFSFALNMIYRTLRSYLFGCYFSDICIVSVPVWKSSRLTRAAAHGVCSCISVWLFLPVRNTTRSQSDP